MASFSFAIALTTWEIRAEKAVYKLRTVRKAGQTGGEISLC
jgi:hypothetical protein